MECPKNPISSFGVRLRVLRKCATRDDRWYCPAVAKSSILPLAAAVTAVALGVTPAAAAPLSPGKRDEAKVVAFPLLAAKAQSPAAFGHSANHVSHQSHESHVSGGGYHSSHYSHSSHDSHSSSVPAPAQSSSAPAAPVSAQPGSAQPAPASSQSLGSPAAVTSGSPSGVAPSQSALVGSPLVSGSGSPAANSGGQGCMFVFIAPFSAAASGIRRLTRRRRAR
jgi:hypothetical protein